MKLKINITQKDDGDKVISSSLINDLSVVGIKI
jgi:hypothetical protein